MRRRRGTILLTVLVVVVIASLTGATAMYMARAQATSATVTLRRAQARALAWSGVQAVMAELASQREALLDGDMPRLTEDWELYEEGSNRAVVRLLPVGVGDDVFASEAGRLNVNTATLEMLAALGFEQPLAQAIVEERKSRPFSSVEDLLRVSGITARVLSGGSDEYGSETSPPLGQLLTVWSFDPNIQSGIGDNASRHRGNLRVNLDLPWSDRLAAAIDDRFGDGSSRVVKTLIDQGTKFQSMADITAALQRLSIEPKDWAAVFDAFTMSDDPYLPGKVDLMRAPVEILAAIPGVGRDTAQEIVDARSSIDRQAAASITWPVVEGVMTAEQFAAAADHLTSRSMQWRVRIEAGIATPQERFSASGEARLRDRIVVEAVIDVASERPQVAYLRDITMLEAATVLYRTLVAGDEDEESAEILDLESLLPEIASEPPLGRSDATPAPLIGPLESPELRLPGLNPRGSGSAGRGPLRPRGGLDLKTDLNLSSRKGGFGDLSFGDLDFGEGSSPTSGLLDFDELFADPAEKEPEGVDRRLGRWTTGRQGGVR